MTCFLKWFFISFFCITAFIAGLIYIAEKYHRNESFFLNASGATSKLEQIVYLKNAIAYEVRALKNRKYSEGMMLPLKRRYGEIIGVHKDGRVEYEYYKENSVIRKSSSLVNLKVINSFKIAERVQSLAHNKAVFDIYKNGDILIWMKGQPLNLLFVNNGYATPDPTPATNMVDRLFAEYYWRLLFKNTN